MVGRPAGAADRGKAPFPESVSQTTLDREDDRWRVFSGLEGEEEDDEEEEEVEDGVREAEETMLVGSLTQLDTRSVATDTWKRGGEHINDPRSSKRF